MAAMAAAQLLDELMGRDRNLAPNDKKKESRWDDQQICKHYLVQFCPNELFINTRADLGPCEKIHDDFLKKEYESSTSYQKMGYEDEFVRFCQGMLSDVERRIRRGKQRLSLGSQEGGIPTPTQVKNNDDQIVMLSERINGLLEQVEALGCEGKVEEAQGMMKLCDQLKDERENLRKANENSHWFQTAEIAAAQEKQMEVCEVCGAFLIVGDAQQRVDDHLMGKQHVGYARIKGALEEIMEKRQKKKEDRAMLRDKERQDRLNKQKEVEKQREKDMEERRKKRDDERRRTDKRRSRSRSRDRERDRDRSKRSRSRDRERDRDRGRKSRSRDRGGARSRGRSRERQRSRGRSRNRSHRRSSHGRDKRRSRSRSRGRDSNRKSRRSGSRSRSKDGRHGSRDREHTRDHRQDSRHKSKHHDSRDDRSNGSPRRSKDDDKAKDTFNDSDGSDRSPWEGPNETDKDVGCKSHSASPSNGASPASPCRMAATAEPNGAKCEGDSEQ